MYRYLNPFSVKMGYSGWTGRDNLGDEALYQIIRLLVRPVDLLPYKVFFKRGKFIEKLERRQLSGMMMGAGTLINSGGLLSLMQGFINDAVPCFCFGAGVLDPKFYCKYPRYPDQMKEWTDLLRLFHSVSVRGFLSANILKDYGLESVRVIGDPVLSFALNTLPPKKRTKIIGINFGTTKNNSLLWGNADKTVFDFIVKITNTFIKQGFEVQYFPIWKNDMQAAVTVAKKVNGDVKICPCTRDMNSYLDALENVDIFIGEKLHSVIGALCCYTPSIMLAYQPKCIDFMNSVSLDKYILQTDQLSEEKLLEMISSISENYDIYRTIVFDKIAHWKNEQRKVAEEIANYFISQ